VNVEAASLLVKVKVAEALWLAAGGPDAIAVSGGTVSIVQVYSVSGPVRASQTPRTAKVWEPSPSAL
jgi:hypothetical protein